MSPAALALTIVLHAAVAAALWWVSPWRPHDQSETPIMVTIEPEPLSGGGAPAAGSAAPAAEPATIAPPVAEPTQQALAPGEPTPPQLQSQVTEPTPPEPSNEVEAETVWQTKASSWKPQLTLEQALPTPEPPPPPTSHDIPKPQRPQPARPVQRAQTAFPPRPAQPPAQQPPGDARATASLSGPTNSSADSLLGHGGERNDYLSRVFRHIEPFRGYPAIARQNGQRGRIVTRVTINRAGELVDIRVDRSSGWPLIDNAEIAAIRRAMPLPPVPAGMVGDPIVLVLPYSYEIR